MRFAIASVSVLALVAGFSLASTNVGAGSGARSAGGCGVATASACDATAALGLAIGAERSEAAEACDAEKKAEAAAACDAQTCDEEKKAKKDCDKDKEACDAEKAEKVAVAAACDACDASEAIALAADSESCPPDCEKACCTEACDKDKEDCDTPAALKHVVKDIEGNDVALADYQGKVLLMVNVASECGYTRHYAGLQELHEAYADQGLVVMGFPCNQFGGQEPGSEGEIAAFCEAEYGVTFPMFSKIDVNGENASPLFAYLTSQERDVEETGEVNWNFEKFLVGREGNLVARFRSNAEPTGDAIVEAIEKALADAE